MALTYIIEVKARQELSQVSIGPDIRQYLLINSDLILFDGVSELTSYRIKENRKVKIFPLSTFEGTLPILQQWVVSNEQWVKLMTLVIPELSNAELLVEPITWNMQVLPGSIVATFEHDGDPITNATWSQSTGIITWNSRPEHNVEWTTFVQWLEFLKLFGKSIQGFGL